MLDKQKYLCYYSNRKREGDISYEKDLLRTLSSWNRQQHRKVLNKRRSREDGKDTQSVEQVL